MTVHPAPLRRRIPARAERTVGTEALTTLVTAATLTSLAAAGFHLVFGRTTSLTACLVVALGFCAGDRMRPHVFAGHGLLPDLGTTVLAQAAACCWFSYAAHDPGLDIDVRHEGGVLYLAMTLVTLGALRAGARSPLRISSAVPVPVCRLFRRLCTVLFAGTPAPAAMDANRNCAERAEDGACVCEVIVGAMGRRGPPSPRRPQHATQAAPTPPT